MLVCPFLLLFLTFIFEKSCPTCFLIFTAILLPINCASISKFVLFTEEVVDLGDYADVVWRAANNVDPQRDCFYLYEGNEQLPTLYFDATRKTQKYDGFTREWPNIVTMDESTMDLVDKKWISYGIGDFLESPSRKYIKQLYRGEAVAEE